MEITDVVNHWEVFGIDESLIAAHFPMAADTKAEIDKDRTTDELLDLGRRLGNTAIGSGHDNFLNGIVVQFDLTLPIKVWTEAQRYHFLDFVSSQSTIHKITNFDFDSEDLFSEYTSTTMIQVFRGLIQHYKYLKAALEEVKKDGTNFFENNHLGIKTEEKLKKEIDDSYLRILYSVPVGLKLTARMTTNYRQLKTIYNQRSTHRLEEWRVFCKWIETLPYFKDLCLRDNV